MTATTTARESKRKDGRLISYPMAAVKIPKGALVCIDPEGYATNGADEFGYAFAGVSYETVDNLGGEPSDLNVRVETSGTFVFVDGQGRGRQSDVGARFNILDNQTVARLTKAGIPAGIAVEHISETLVRIRIDRFAS